MTDYGVELSRVELSRRVNGGWFSRFWTRIQGESLASFGRVQFLLSCHSERFIGSVGVVSRVVRGDEGLFWVRRIRAPTFLGPVSPTSQLWQIAVDEVSRSTRPSKRAYWSCCKWIMKQFRLRRFSGSLPQPPEILQPRGDRESRVKPSLPSAPFVSSPLSSGKKCLVSRDRTPTVASDAAKPPKGLARARRSHIDLARRSYFYPPSTPTVNLHLHTRSGETTLLCSLGPTFRRENAFGDFRRHQARERSGYCAPERAWPGQRLLRHRPCSPKTRRDGQNRACASTIRFTQ